MCCKYIFAYFAIRYCLFQAASFASDLIYCWEWIVHYYQIAALNHLYVKMILSSKNIKINEKYNTTILPK